MTDAELLHEFAAHQSQSAFEELVRRYGKLVQSVALRMVGNRPDADDVVQDVFLTLAKKARHFPWQASVAGWLHRVTQRAALQQMRSTKRRRQHEKGASQQQAMHAGSTLDSTLDQRETTQVIDRELAQLPDKYRSAIVLHHFEQMRYDQAAERLGVKEGTFAVRLKRARHLLRDRLTRRGLSMSTAGAMGLSAWLNLLAEETASAHQPVAGPWEEILGASQGMNVYSRRVMIALCLIVSLAGTGSFWALQQMIAGEKGQWGAKETKPVEVHGLAAWLQIQETTQPLDDLRFYLHLKNVSRKAFWLRDAKWTNPNAKVILRSADGKWACQYDYQGYGFPQTPSSGNLKPDAVRTLAFPNPVKPKLTWLEKKNDAQADEPRLTPGTYFVSVQMQCDGPKNSNGDVYWKGTLTTKPLAIRLVTRKDLPNDFFSVRSTPIEKGGLQFHVELSTKTFFVGDEPNFRFHISNLSKKEITFSSADWSYQKAGVFVATADGTNRWQARWTRKQPRTGPGVGGGGSSGQAYTPIRIGHSRSLVFPGRHMANIVWHPVGKTKGPRLTQLPKGEYTLQVEWTYPPSPATPASQRALKQNGHWVGHVLTPPVPFVVGQRPQK